MQKTATIITLAVVVLGMTTVWVTSLLTVNQSVPNTGSVIKTIGVEAYWDKACTSRVSSVEWGTLQPGGSKSSTLFIKNNGTVAEVLSMTAGNWTPSYASTCITVSWNCTNYVLPHASVVAATFNLSVAEVVGNLTSFAFSTVIAGTEKT